MIVNKNNGFGNVSNLEDYKPGSVFEFFAEKCTPFCEYWLVVDQEILNIVQLSDAFCDDLSIFEQKHNSFFKNNIFAVNLETGAPCFFNEDDLENMKPVKISANVD